MATQLLSAFLTDWFCKITLDFRAILSQKLPFEVVNHGRASKPFLQASYQRLPGSHDPQQCNHDSSTREPNPLSHARFSISRRPIRCCSLFTANCQPITDRRVVFRLNHSIVYCAEKSIVKQYIYWTVGESRIGDNPRACTLVQQLCGQTGLTVLKNCHPRA